MPHLPSRSVRLRLSITSLLLGATLACAEGARSPVSPTAVDGSTAANPDGSTLKVTAPQILAPRGGDTAGSRRPEFAFTNAVGRFTGVVLQYRIEAFDAAGTLLQARVVGQGAGGQTNWSADVDLPYDTVFAWRVRAELDGQTGPWSTRENFRTPVSPVPPVPPVPQPRSIGINEAFSIIAKIHDDLRFDLGARSTRDFRIAFWSAAVAAVHYGHPRFNPQGPDPGWCIKDAGGGRPISDDVIVVCQSREYWDLIGGVGANGYFFRINYDGRLPGSQNVYPPPRSALNLLNR